MLIASQVGSPARAETIYGVVGGSFRSDPAVAGGLVTIDSTTGVGTYVGTPISGTGLTGLIAIGNRLIASTSAVGGAPRLIDIDPATGALNSIVSNITLNGQPAAVTDLAYDATSGTIYGIGAFGVIGNNDRLVTIDEATGVVTVVGDTGLPGGFVSIGFDVEGTLYGIANFDSVVNEINPANAAILNSHPLGASLGALGLTVNPSDGQVFFTRGDGTPFGRQLFVVDPTTGPAVFVGNIGLNGNVHDLAFLEPTIEVVIDIKPGSDPNAINPRSKGLIPVAILTTSIADGDPLDFDAWDVDPSTLAFGPNGAGIAHSTGHAEDVDGDGDLDMVAHFKTQETGIACGDTDATLTGQTFGGEPIEGTDAIKTSGCSSGSSQVLARGTAPNDPIADRAERRTLRREARKQARLERRLKRQLR